ncbi:hypothetical protein NDU88_001672 [Pleurodeles waltl]|uniref:Uncharacterized protein n=1 Tax=Pleurodeles waltl TaxID=8319 RepID=A0AAV7KTF8_PLEWA|nr:hypothetical protein NDU88_001672 [Pleurodeles waltl]
MRSTRRADSQNQCKVEDFLSRMSLPSDKVGDFVEDEECVAVLFDDGMVGIDEKEWKETMKGDKELQKVLTFVNNGWLEKK